MLPERSWLPLVATAALSMSGCSQLQIAYSFLDTLIEREFNNYFELTPRQEIDLAEFADTYQVWHRGAMVPRYAKLLRREAQIHATGAFSRATFRDTRAAVDALYKATVRPFIPQVVDFLTHQNPGQLAALERRMNERIAEYREKAKERTPEKSLAKIEEGFENVLGALTPEQRAIIKSEAAPFIDGSTAWIDERARRNEELLSRLRKGNAEATGRYVAAWWLEPLTISPPDYRARTEQMLATIDEVIFEVLARMTPTQRETLVSTLREYAEELEAISS